MKIEAKILYSPNGNLADAYRQGVLTSDAEWVLMLDHDVMILHPNWYKLCEIMIDKFPMAGLFTCYTNRIGSNTQLHINAPKNTESVICHRQFAKNVFIRNMFGATNITARSHKVSGFFMLIKKEALSVCNLKDGFFGVDWHLKDEIVRAGYEAWRIDGLYCYHLRDREPSWIEGDKVSLDYDK